MLNKILNQYIKYFHNKEFAIKFFTSITVAILLRHIGDSNFLWIQLYTWEYWIRFVFIVIDIFVLWQTILYFTKYFDKKLPWNSNLKKRAFVQYIIITLIGLITATITEFLYLYIIENDSFDVYFITLHIPILTLVALLISFYYSFMFFIDKDKIKALKTTFISNITYQKGASTFNISINDIAYFFYSDRMVFLVDKNGYINYIHFTMEKLSKIINPKKFIRVNRQFIVSKKAITKYTEIENRKIEIFVSPSTQKGSRIIVSSKKRTQIIKWILNN
jgi:hypothetical protein